MILVLIMIFSDQQCSSNKRANIPPAMLQENGCKPLKPSPVEKRKTSVGTVGAVMKAPTTTGIAGLKEFTAEQKGLNLNTTTTNATAPCVTTVLNDLNTASSYIDRSSNFYVPYQSNSPSYLDMAHPNPYHNFLPPISHFSHPVEGSSIAFPPYSWPRYQKPGITVNPLGNQLGSDTGHSAGIINSGIHSLPEASVVNAGLPSTWHQAPVSQKQISPITSVQSSSEPKDHQTQVEKDKPVSREYPKLTPVLTAAKSGKPTIYNLYFHDIFTSPILISYNVYML